MAIDLESTNKDFQLNFLLFRTHDLYMTCTDSIFSAYGLTTENYSTLAAIKYLGGSARVGDLSQVLERKANSVSMIVDRMVRAGLVRRSRGKTDRREVRVSMTDKGQNAFEMAMPACLEFNHEILSPLSDGDKATLATLLRTIRHRALEYVCPEIDIAKIDETDVTNQANIADRLTR
ncbi:MAG: MarR family transcriptional regulator [Dehalococcoidia bacterium]|nr:MarR family transcriptional regulator [Dehalococcoidia bacterium]